MPYAPGVAPHAGEIFAASQFGSRISENVQNWMKNRQEREQTTATAEMLGRYLKDDPHAMEMFGEKFSDIPKGSAAQARATIGAATVYIADRYRKAQMENMKADNERQNKTLKLQEDQLALSKAKADREAAEAAKYDRFGQLVEGHFRQPANVQIPYAAEPVTLTPADLARYQGMARIAGLPGSAPMLSALARYAPALQNQDPKVVELDGHRFAYFPKTGAGKELYGDDEEGEGGDLKAVTVRDDEGNVRAHMLRTQKGGYQQLPSERNRGITPSDRTTAIKTRADLRKQLADLRLFAAGAKGDELKGYQAQMAELQGDLDTLGEILKAQPETPAAPATPAAEKESAAPSKPAAEVDRIKMIHPDGRLVGVRSDQEEAAIKQGFKRAD